jgi:hypothetical protein
MALTQWEMQGWEFVNCNCNWGCPCQFNQLPSHGNCAAYMFTHIERGHFGDVRLDGLNWGVIAAWPGAIHQGNGTMRVVVDERGDLKQRAAMEAVATGKETEPMKIVWSVFAAMTSTFLATVAAKIELSSDFESRKAVLRVPGIVTGDLTPITNVKTGEPSRVRLVLPNGFEFTEAELASGTGKVTGDIPLDFTATHAHLAHVHWNTQGVVRPSA